MHAINGWHVHKRGSYSSSQYVHSAQCGVWCSVGWTVHGAAQTQDDSHVTTLEVIFGTGGGWSMQASCGYQRTTSLRCFFSVFIFGSNRLDLFVVVVVVPDRVYSAVQGRPSFAPLCIVCDHGDSSSLG